VAAGAEGSSGGVPLWIALANARADAQEVICMTSRVQAGLMPLLANLLQATHLVAAVTQRAIFDIYGLFQRRMLFVIELFYRTLPYSFTSFLLT
jgi:hypothetical protein